MQRSPGLISLPSHFGVPVYSALGASYPDLIAWLTIIQPAASNSTPSSMPSQLTLCMCIRSVSS
jgi:hypothetical protein